MKSLRFELHRAQDLTGVSGVGVVADGVVFPDGVVALRWRGGFPTSVVFHDRGIVGVEAVHGHGGATRIVWLDREDAAPFDDDLPERVFALGTTWVRCAGCEQVNHKAGTNRWRELAGGAHADGGSIRKWVATQPPN